MEVKGPLQLFCFEMSNVEASEVFKETFPTAGRFLSYNWISINCGFSKYSCFSVKPNQMSLIEIDDIAKTKRFFSTLKIAGF